MKRLKMMRLSKQEGRRILRQHKQDEIDFIKRFQEHLNYEDKKNKGARK